VALTFLLWLAPEAAWTSFADAREGATRLVLHVLKQVSNAVPFTALLMIICWFASAIVEGRIKALMHTAAAHPVGSAPDETL